MLPRWPKPSPLTLGWLGLIKLDIKCNENFLLKAMQKNLSQPILTPWSIFMWTYIHASADDMVGITKQKKKYWGALDVNVLFFESRDAHAEIFERLLFT